MVKEQLAREAWKRVGGDGVKGEGIGARERKNRFSSPLDKFTNQKNQLDHWQRGKYGTGSRAEPFTRAIRSSTVSSCSITPIRHCIGGE